MTIVHIGPPHLPILYNLGGATERRIREIASRQAQAGDRVVVYSAEDHAGVADFRGAEIHSIDCRRKGLARAAEFMIKSLRSVREHKPDVIHFHALAEGAAFSKMFAGVPQAKTVLSFDYFIFRRGKENPLFPWYRRALNSFSALLPVSDYCKHQAASYWSIPEDHMQVLYNGVSLQQFAPDSQSAAARRVALGLAQKATVLLYVGRICEQKGSDLLIQAYAKLLAEGRNVQLVMAGPIGQFGQKGSSTITRLIEQHQGIYLGPVEENLLPSIYNMADIFVLPTRANEMFGMAAIEAQACGRPVVCSNHGGLPEVVGCSSGLLFESGDAEGLAQQLRLLLDNPTLRKRLQEAAVPNARRFRWETITAQLRQVYQQA